MGLGSFLGKLVGSGVTETANGVADAIDRFVQTKEEKEAAELLRMKMQQEPDKWQIELNKVEASHRSIFVAGWRPALGWTCVIGLFQHFIINPNLQTLLNVMGFEVTVPVLEVGTILTLVFGMLGLGSLRSYEKTKGLTN